MVTLPLPDGSTLKMPEAQARELARLTQLHPDSTWHLADCGCCACLHPGGDALRGWIVGADGGSEYREEAHR